MQIFVDNIKCGGCANSISKRLVEIEGVADVEVDVEQGCIDLNFDAGVSQEAMCEILEKQLLQMGYPRVGSVSGLDAMGAKAKSFVSCAVGKLDK